MNQKSLLKISTRTNDEIARTHLLSKSSDDLAQIAWRHRTVVKQGDIPGAAIVFVPKPGYNVICLPNGLSPLEYRWQLAYEIDHLLMHCRPERLARKVKNV